MSYLHTDRQEWPVWLKLHWHMHDLNDPLQHTTNCSIDSYHHLHAQDVSTYFQSNVTIANTLFSIFSLSVWKNDEVLWSMFLLSHVQISRWQSAKLFAHWPFQEPCQIKSIVRTVCRMHIQLIRRRVFGPGPAKMSLRVIFAQNSFFAILASSCIDTSTHQVWRW